jgi:hypothetical protein
VRVNGGADRPLGEPIDPRIGNRSARQPQTPTTHMTPRVVSFKIKFFHSFLIFPYRSFNMDTAISSSVYCRPCGMSFSHASALKDHIRTGHQGLGDKKNLVEIQVILAYEGEFAGLISNHESRRRFSGDMIGNLESSRNYTSKHCTILAHTPH